MMIGFIYWVKDGGLEGFAITWCTVYLVFVFVMIIAFYFGGKMRIRMEK